MSPDSAIVRGVEEPGLCLRARRIAFFAAGFTTRLLLCLGDLFQLGALAATAGSAPFPPFFLPPLPLVPALAGSAGGGSTYSSRST